MWLDVITLGIVIVGLVLYTVLGGADFGAGVWQLLAGVGTRGRRIRNHAHHANAPVWEANHVWLILVITALWTGYPTVFGAIFSTLAIPIFLAALGIILRGMTYVLQNAADARTRRLIETTFAVSSILTPFMLGTVIGAIASGRVPVGNARGDPLTAWVNPTSIVAGILASVTGAFLAAVYLAADADRLGDPDLRDAFHNRAVVCAVIAGMVAIGGLGVIHGDAPALYLGLVHGWGLAAVIVSALAGLGSLALLLRQGYQPARLSASLAVAALLLGWAAAQYPYLLPPALTITAAAAPPATQIALIVSIAVGALVLFPSLAILFRLALSGRFDPGPPPESTVDTKVAHRVRARRSGRLALGLLVLGIVLLTIAETAAAHAVGVVCLISASVAAFAAVAPDQLASVSASSIQRRQKPG
jgi:cytochrome bd ubiquinol oxidase subunit II